MYAVIFSGGKQYRVEEGEFLDVELLEGEPGESVELDQVYFLENDGEYNVGTPTLEGVRVIAEIDKHFKAKKVMAMRRKKRKNVTKVRGHRQNYTRLLIREIVRG